MSPPDHPIDDPDRNHSHESDHTIPSDPRTRFQREAETLGRLKHPCIGAIFESGRTDEGQHFFARELVCGPAPDAYIIENDLSVSDRLALFRKICEGVNYAHQHGVIHRDLKPSNILIGEDGEPKILDFGLARITDTDAQAVSMVSEVGAIKGTLPYMSPEQARGDPDEIDLRTDVYSLGVILYEETVRIYEREPGSDRADLVASLQSLGILYKSLGEYDAAKSHYLRVIALLEETSGDGGSRLAQALNNLANAYKLQGNYVKARLLYERSISVAEEKLGPEHPVTLSARNNLGSLLRTLGEWEESRALLEETLKLREKVLSPDDPSLATTLYNLGLLMVDMGDDQEARAYLDRSLAISEAAYGPDHPKVARSLVGVGAYLVEKEDHAVAKPYFERALHIQVNSTGPEHFMVGVIVHDLGIVAQHFGEYEHADSLYDRAGRAWEVSLGEEHSYVLANLDARAELRQLMGDPVGAEEFENRASVIRMRTEGK